MNIAIHVLILIFYSIVVQSILFQKKNLVKILPYKYVRTEKKNVIKKKVMSN